MLIKRGFGITLDESLNAAEYLATEGNRKVVFCLRGMKTNMGDPHRNFVDFSHVPVGQAPDAHAGRDRSVAFGRHARRARPTACSTSSTSSRRASSPARTWCSSTSIPIRRSALVDGPQALLLSELPPFLDDVAIAREAYEKRAKLAREHARGALIAAHAQSRIAAAPASRHARAPGASRRTADRPGALSRAALARRRARADDLAVPAAAAGRAAAARAHRDARRRLLGLRLARRATRRRDAPLVVLFHGLEGGSASHYARALLAAPARARLARRRAAFSRLRRRAEPPAARLSLGRPRGNRRDARGDPARRMPRRVARCTRSACRSAAARC